MTSTPELRDQIEQNFQRTKHAVDDLGWDPDGTDPITVPMRDGTLIEVPPGTYRISKTQSGSPTAWGIRGTGDDPEDVRFVGPEGAVKRLFNVNGGRNVLLENLCLDQRDSWKGAVGMALKVQDGLLVKDVTYAGKTPNEHTGATALLNVYAFGADGVAILDGLDITGPSELTDYPACPLAVFSGKEHAGTLYVRNSEIANRGEHAIYASRCVGDVRIEDCVFTNNQNTQARISGDGSYCKNSTFVWDMDSHPNRGSFQATTGLTFEAGFQGFSGGLVEGCEFRCKSSAGNSGCLKVDGSHGAVTVRDCEFQIDADGAEPIWADAPGDSHMIDRKPDKPWDITLEEISVTGSGAPTHGNDAAVELQNRDGSTLTFVDVDVSKRDGLHLTDGTYHLSGCSISPGEGRKAIVGNGTVRRADDSVLELAHHLRVRGTEGRTRYEIDVSGRAGLVEVGEFAATPADGGTGEAVVQNDDGTWTLSGVVAAGGGDTFRFDGEVLDVRVVEGAYPVVEVDGEAVQFRADDEPVTVPVQEDLAEADVRRMAREEFVRGLEAAIREFER